MQSGEAVVLTVFGSHFFKEISRSQLESAAKSLLPLDLQHSLKKADKVDFIIPLARAFIRKAIVKLPAKANFKSLAREEITKVGTF